MKEELKMENRVELPAGWKWVKLGEVCEIFSGTSAPQDEKYFEKGKYPFVRVSDLSKNKRTTNLNEVKGHINELCIKELNMIKASKGTIIFPKSGAAITTNNRAILGIDAFIVSHLAAVKPKENIAETYFVYYWLCLTDMVQYMENIGYPSLKLSMISRILIPLPPLAEQKRIAAKLQEMMKDIETARTACEKQLEAAKSLPSAYLREVFECDEAQKWEKKKLGEICKIYQPKTITLNELKKNGRYKVYGANGVIGYYDKYNHENPEVLITCRGATCGTVNISEPFSWITGNAMVVSPLSNDLDKEYLFYFLKKSDLLSTISGSAQPQITRAPLSPVEVYIPAIEIQKRIAAYLKEKIGQAEKLRASIEKELETINLLPQSILSKAFRGEI
jgi:type I restriction enzyme S subunit